jgi:hypothetical protein
MVTNAYVASNLAHAVSFSQDPPTCPHLLSLCVGDCGAAHDPDADNDPDLWRQGCGQGCSCHSAAAPGRGGRPHHSAGTTGDGRGPGGAATACNCAEEAEKCTKVGALRSCKIASIDAQENIVLLFKPHAAPMFKPRPCSPFPRCNPTPHQVLTYYTMWQLWRNAAGAVGTQRAAFVTQATSASDIRVNYVPDTRHALSRVGAWCSRALCTSTAGAVPSFRLLPRLPLCPLTTVHLAPTNSISTNAPSALPPFPHPHPGWTARSRLLRRRVTVCCLTTRSTTWWPHSMSRHWRSHSGSSGGRGSGRPRALRGMAGRTTPRYHGMRALWARKARRSRSTEAIQSRGQGQVRVRERGGSSSSSSSSSSPVELAPVLGMVRAAGAAAVVVAAASVRQLQWSRVGCSTLQLLRYSCVLDKL